MGLIAVILMAGPSGNAGAQMLNAPRLQAPYSQIPGHVRPVGLWDKPNAACMTKCQVFLRAGCYKRLAEKNPTADASAIQDKCEDKYSVCLYDCMCDTCDEDQIIIRP